MYIERLILGEVHGEDARHFQELLGYGELVRTVNSLKDDPNLTKLRPDLTGIDPDDAFSRIPYEKGCLLLFYLEKVVGGKDKMVGWLQSYFKTFQRQSISADQMREHFLDHFKDAQFKEKIDWDVWFNGINLPPYDPTSDLDQTLYNKSRSLATVWKDKKGEGASEKDLSWDAAQTMAFLDNLINTALPLESEVLSKIEGLYHLSDSNNPEIVYRWFIIWLSSNALSDHVRERLEQFLSRNGRGIYLRPIYSKLIALSESHPQVITSEKVKQIYTSNRPFYHAVIRNSFDATLLRK